MIACEDISFELLMDRICVEADESYERIQRNEMNEKNCIKRNISSNGVRRAEYLSSIAST